MLYLVCMKFRARTLATRIAYFLDTCAVFDAVDAFDTFADFTAFLSAQVSPSWHGVAL